MVTVFAFSNACAWFWYRCSAGGNCQPAWGTKAKRNPEGADNDLCICVQLISSAKLGIHTFACHITQTLDCLVSSPVRLHSLHYAFIDWSVHSWIRRLKTAESDSSPCSVATISTTISRWIKWTRGEGSMFVCVCVCAGKIQYYIICK